MFLGSTDKELRKGKSSSNRRPARSARQGSSRSSLVAPTTTSGNEKTSSTAADQIVDAAQAAREERARLREVSHFIIKVQALVRSFTSRQKTVRAFRELFDKQMDGIKKVADVFQLKNTIFNPPVSVILSLYRYLYIDGMSSCISNINKRGKSTLGDKKLFIKHREDVSRFIKFLQYVLLPSFTLPDSSTNGLLTLCGATELNSIDLFGLQRVQKLITSIFAVLDPLILKHQVSPMGNVQQTIKQVILPSLHTMLGMGTVRDNGIYAPKLQAVFRQIRMELIDREANGNSFFYYLYSLTSSHNKGLLKTSVDDEDIGQSMMSKFQSCLYPHSITICSTLFAFARQLCVMDVEVTSATGHSERRTDLLCNYLFSVPMSTLSLSKEVLLPFVTSNQFSYMCKRVLTAIHINTGNHKTNNDVIKYNIITKGTLESALGLPMSSHEAITSAVWLMGNIFSLAEFIPVLRDTQGTMSTSSDKTTTTAAAADGTVFDGLKNGGSVDNRKAGGRVADLYEASNTENEREKDCVGDTTLHDYLQLTFQVLQTQYLPFAFQARSTLLWIRNGHNLVAAGLPSALQQQILTIIDRSFMLSCYTRILIPIQEDEASYIGGAAVYNASKRKAAEKRLKRDQLNVVEALQKDAKSIAAKSLEVEQKEKTWFTGQWASKLMRKVGKAFGITSGSKEDGNSFGELQEVNEALKEGGSSSEAAPVSVSQSAMYQTLPVPEYTENRDLIFALIHLWAMVLPQMSQIHISKGSNKSTSMATWRVLTSLVFNSRVTDRLWMAALKYVEMEYVAEHFSVSQGHYTADNPFVAMIVTFACCLRTVLGALDDEELYTYGKPLSLPQLLVPIRCMKQMLFKILESSSSSINEFNGKIGNDDDDISMSTKQFQHFASRAIIAVLNDLYARWARRPFSSIELWNMEETEGLQVMLRNYGNVKGSFANALLFHIPWCISFHDRMTYFREIVDTERLVIQGSNDVNSGERRNSVVFQIRRNLLLQDGMKAMEKLTSGAAVKQRIQIQYINAVGQQEAGIDIGGLFKDFVTDLSDRIFDPSYGLFCLTEENLLYPNPAACQLYESAEIDNLFSFLGRVLGKALFENITLQPQFAHFFLAFMHNRYNFQNLFSDLVTLDRDLHKNLMFLKHYDGDVRDLCLSFSVTDSALGGNKEIELYPGGSNVDVTKTNKFKYVNYVAKYYLHDRLKQQAGAFFHGLYQVISPDLLSIFCAPELQILISGSHNGVSLEDLQANTRYSGYTSGDSRISNFWAILQEMDARDRGLLIRFVTSCERPPSLGFSALHPKFTIQRVDCNDDARLASASTCFNVLKLPTYSSKRVMKEKLLQSIRSGAGFELS
jgi:ubiquitin-protein ligase E3 C